jgi:ankyrin repeat protein
MKKYQQQWNKVLKFTPTKDVKEMFDGLNIYWNMILTGKYGKLKGSPLAIIAVQRYDAKWEPSQWSPLHIAAEQGNLEFSKYIIEKTNDPNPNGEYGTTALHLASHNGHLKICELIIDNLEDKNPGDNGGMTPLHIASEMGHFDVCKLLIQNIDDKNPSAHDGCTPLHLATNHGHLEIVRLIVETGVGKSPLFDGKTPLDFVRPRCRYRFYPLLIENSSQIWNRIMRDISTTVVLFVFSYLIITFIWGILLLLFWDIPWHRNSPGNDQVFVETVFIAPCIICLLLVSMIWIYLSGCIHKCMKKCNHSLEFWIIDDFY